MWDYINDDVLWMSSKEVVDSTLFKTNLECPGFIDAMDESIMEMQRGVGGG